MAASRRIQSRNARTAGRALAATEVTRQQLVRGPTLWSDSPTRDPCCYSRSMVDGRPMAVPRPCTAACTSMLQSVNPEAWVRSGAVASWAANQFGQSGGRPRWYSSGQPRHQPPVGNWLGRRDAQAPRRGLRTVAFRDLADPVEDAMYIAQAGLAARSATRCAAGGRTGGIRSVPPAP